MTNSSSYVHLPVTYYAQKKTDRTSVQHCAYNLWPTESLDSQDAEIYQGIQVFADSPPLTLLQIGLTVQDQK